MNIETWRMPLARTIIFNIWKRNLLLWHKTRAQQIFGMLWSPVLVPLLFSYGFAPFVSEIRGYSYVDFFFPSLLGIATMWISFSESCLSSVDRRSNQNTYSTMLLAPMDSDQILVAEILWATFKGAFGGSIILIVGLFLGLVSWAALFPAFLLMLISSFLFACLGMLTATYINNFENIIFSIFGLILPMSLLCDTYFPLAQLPKGGHFVAQFFPLTHFVTSARSLLLHRISNFEIVDATELIFHIGFMLVFAFLTFQVARRRFSRLLIQ